jgi:hypothetical protein
MKHEEILKQLNMRLMSAEEELRLATGAVKASKFSCNEMDSFIARSNEELLKEMSDGTLTTETVAAVMRWLGRARHQLNESASKIMASHAERRGEVESLRWIAGSLSNQGPDEEDK